MALRCIFPSFSNPSPSNPEYEAEAFEAVSVWLAWASRRLSVACLLVFVIVFVFVFVVVFVFIFIFVFVFVFVFDFGDRREEAAAHSSSATPDLRALSYCLWELGACVMDTGLFINREWLIL